MSSLLFLVIRVLHFLFQFILYIFFFTYFVASYNLAVLFPTILFTVHMQSFTSYFNLLAVAGGAAICILWYGVKVGPGPQDPGPQHPGTRDSPLNLKVGRQDTLQSLKVGYPHLLLMHFFRIFLRFFYLFICVSFLNKIQKNTNCE